MASLRNKRKLAAFDKDNCAEHPRINLAQNSKAPRSQEEYINQVSDEIEIRVTKNLSKEFSRTESRISGALSRLDEFFSQPGNTGSLRIRPRDIPERTRHKPRIE